MDDEILEFGSVNTQNFQSLQNISSVVQHSEGVSWKLCGVWPVTPELPGQELWPGCRLAASEGVTQAQSFPHGAFTLAFPLPRMLIPLISGRHRAKKQSAGVGELLEVRPSFPH